MSDALTEARTAELREALMTADEIANRIALLLNPQPDMSGRQINRLHGERRRRVEDLAADLARAREALTAERERIAAHLEERAAYFERTTGHWDRTDTARSYRATAADIRGLPRPKLPERIRAALASQTQREDDPALTRSGGGDA